MATIPTEVNVSPRRESVMVEVNNTSPSAIEVFSNNPNEETHVVESYFSTRPLQRVAPVNYNKINHTPSELRDIAQETDTLSSNIIGEDEISNPNVKVVPAENTTSLVNDVDNRSPKIVTPSKEKESISVEVVSNMNNIIDEDDESIELSYFTEKTPVENTEEPKEIINNENVKETQNSLNSENIQEVQQNTKVSIPINNEINNTPTTPIKQVVAKPVQVEDDPLDIGIVTTGKEEIKPVTFNSEDMFVPFDSSTEKTIHTEKERTEIVIPNFSDEELANMVKNITSTSRSNDSYAKEILAKKNLDLTTYESRVNRSTLFETPRRKVEEESFKEAIEKNDEIVNFKKIDNVTYKDAKSSKSQLKRLENGAIIDSKNSLPITMALLGGIKKIHFYNSGFWVIVRPPLISELHTYFTRCQQETAMYGRQFGQLSFLPADIEISRAGLELFKSCIDSSNLANCKEGDTFERCLAVSDERTYLWGLASLMFPEGTEIEYVCSNKDCHHIDRVLVDLAKMRYFDYSRLGLEALKYCHSSEQRTEEDIKNYKENILKTTKNYDLDKQWSLVISEPSLFDQLEFKSEFIEEISSTLELTQFDKIDDFISTRYFRLLSPWVKRVSYTNDADGKKIYLSDERSAIVDVVDALQLRYNNLPEIINTHIKNSQVSYFCYSYNACPKCGNIPTTEIEGLIPCDIQQSFFSLTIEKLK